MSPEDWLWRAESALELAKHPYENVRIVPEDLCYQAQQAAEKAIKGVYVFRGHPHRFTHNIAELLTGLRDIGVDVPQELRCATDLTRYALNERYPHLGEYVSAQELAVAIEIAELDLAWVQTQLAPPQL